MKDLQLLHQKLDQVLQELSELKKGVINNHGNDLLSLPEAAKALSLSTSRVYALIYEGRLKPLQRRKFARIQFSQHAIQQYLYANNSNTTDNIESGKQPNL